MLALLAAMVGSVSFVAAPAVAGPVDAPWVASGPTAVATSDGTATAAQMDYNLLGAGFATRSWEFEATAASPATAANPIKVPYTWQGLHAWFQVTTRLDMIVNDSVVATLEQHGPEICCTTPSNGFLYGGVATFDNVPAGATYGFRLSGSNSDFNNFLRGTFTLSIKPFLDATIGQDNRDWTGAEDVSAGPAPADTRLIEESGEARWFKFAVLPSQDVSVTLQGLTGTDNLPADYDIALYGDVGAAFDRLLDGDDLAVLTATSAASGVGDSQVPQYPPETSTIPTKTNPPTGQQFAPHVYSPHVYSPHVYSPHVYSPHVYSPHVYSPRVYTPGSFIAANVSDSSLSDAFSAAQNQTLLAASTNTGTADETVSATTGNTTGFFYVRVQGHGDTDFDATDAFQLTRTQTGNAACAGLQTFPKDYVAPPNPTQDTVIVTDTNRLGLASGTQARTDYLASLGQLAAATDGAVVDLAGSQQIDNLWTQVAGHAGCPQAVNMVAEAVKDIVDDLRNDQSKYVVLAGGDEVIPFFRYPDTSGLGPESEFKPPVLDSSPSGASLLEDQVQGQDAYGSDTTVTIGGVTVPLPELAVGRLVKTPGEITGTIANYLSLTNGRLPTPDSSLVTGYDFLADAADAVNQELTAALPATGAVTDTLITHPGKTPPETPWTGPQLGQALLGSHHDIVYLAGHFSANDTLAADFQTSFDADELDPAFVPDPQNAPTVTNADKLKNTLVLSAGCHSGYNIVNSASVPDQTNPFDWTQRMAQQKALLIGGTGFQYGDTDFLEYSERLYLDIARRLHEAPAAGQPATPIPVGKALMLAKQDYLSSLTTLTGIDQKAMLEATLYGLPMTGFDAPRRSPLPTSSSNVTTTPVAAGTPGAAYQLATAEAPVTTTSTNASKPVVSGGQTLNLTWLNGADGVTIQPGAPAIPKQVEDVTVNGKVLRGVGFWSGDYADTSGVLPLTGAPAIEGSTPNSTFESAQFFPQRLATVNYFGALGSSGRTSLILNPAQYKSDPNAGQQTIPTNTVRKFTNLGMRLFYTPTNLAVPAGQSDPTLAAPPAIGDVTGTVLNGVVTFSARVTGDPVAGVQQVWVTWTGQQGGAGHGQWRSILLTQNPDDSTLWTGTLQLPSGQPFQGVRFLVQAASGVGTVSLAVAEGGGYGVEPAGFVDTATVVIDQVPVSDEAPMGINAVVKDVNNVPVAGRLVRFTVLRGDLTLYTFEDETDGDGRLVLPLPAGRTTPPAGELTVVAAILTASELVKDSDRLTVSFAGGALTPSPASLVAHAGTQFPAFSVSLADPNPVVNVPVTFTLPSGAPGATFAAGPNTTSPTTATVRTNVDGVATPPAMTAKTTAGSFLLSVSTPGAETITVPMAAQYGIGAFVSPVSSNTTTTSTGTTPVKVSALLASGAKLSDAEANALVQAGQVQIRWREVGTTLWLTSSSVTIGYDAKKDFFQADLKASTVGWLVGRSYTVNFRILPRTTDPQPQPQTANDVLQRDFDLGNRSFTVRVTK